jgi:hypothetical protein
MRLFLNNYFDLRVRVLWCRTTLASILQPQAWWIVCRELSLFFQNFGLWLSRGVIGRLYEGRHHV